jgi:hypothetical protein
MEVQLSDRNKIDRAAFHEEVRFYKRQQWAVATAGVALLGAFLATVRGLHMEAWEKYVAVALIDFERSGLEAQLPGRRLNLAHLRLDGGIADIADDRQSAQTGDELAQKFELLRTKIVHLV